MRQFAVPEFLIWIIVFVVISLIQGWKQMSGGGDQEGEDQPDERPAPPTRRANSQPPPTGRPAPAEAPPVMRRQPQPEPATWRADDQQLAELKRRLAAKMQAKVVQPPPLIRTAVTPEAVPVPEPPKKITAPTPAAIVLRKRSQNRWAIQLHQRNKIREAVVLAEIIGPPKGAY